MTTLAIECASEACSIALFDDAGALIAHDHRVLGRGHAERLVPMIAALPDRGRATRIAVSRGPGSFTGVRIGLATARALGLAWGADVTGYPTMALMAALARAEAGAVPVGVAMSGGHGEWFVQNFGADPARDGPLASLPPEAAAAAITADIVIGNQAAALVARRGAGTAIDRLPDARGVPGLPAAALTPDLGPIYGRGPDAKLPPPRAPGNAPVTSDAPK